MGKVRVASFGVSLDGYGAGLWQSRNQPLGRGGEKVFRWFFGTRTFKAMHGLDPAEGTTGIDEEFAQVGFANVGAWIPDEICLAPSAGHG